ncbi:DNA primase [Spiroplasma taiwanense]|uniref:DNA primase n=1 Tax=Spiroplasma taiwanense CT-1 TaxID=1276220 RepID=S5LUE5_9MOLU|nr:DNA primase [Spiroplasma taiwanense]AGR41409.1 DNA primase [Spiroplasma taiwanense CT-1]
MAISQQQIDLVLNKANIVDVISKYLDLQKKGRNYLSVCPFHDDSDPSLHVSLDKKIFKCFVCGTGGNVITFIQEFNNITFFKAVSLLAKDLKIKIDGIKDYDDKPKYSSKESKLFLINESIAALFNGLLISNLSKKARDYLRERRINASEILKFTIGFCPININIFDYLIDLGFKKEEIFESGLVYQKGVTYKSFFENRLIFPIRNEESNIIGFSGRIMDVDENPKYKNSIENLIFKKSKLAYNFNNAKKEARIKNEILILEGFMDVISLEKIDIKNSVAIMGTSLSDYHIKLFSRVAKNYKLFLDGDNAGIKAALKTAALLMEKRINVTIIENTTGKDPDELVKDGEVNLIYQMIENAKHPVDFAINYYSKDLDINDSNQINEFISNILNLLKYEINIITINKILQTLANISQIKKEAIEKLFENYRIKINKNNTEELKADQNNIQDYFDQDKINTLMNSYYQEENFDSNLPMQGFEFQKINEFKVKNYENQYKTAAKLAESSIIWSLLNSDKILNEIKKHINKIETYSIKKIINFIIEEYENNNYVGHDWELIANDIKKIDIKYCEYIFEIRNKFYAKIEHSITEKGLNDAFDAIEIYKLALEIEKFNLKISETYDSELQKSYLEHIEELRKQKNKILMKRST